MHAIYRADQVGSLLRPPELLAARAAFEDGRMSADDLRAAEDRAILDALAMQRVETIASPSTTAMESSSR